MSTCLCGSPRFLCRLFLISIIHALSQYRLTESWSFEPSHLLGPRELARVLTLLTSCVSSLISILDGKLEPGQGLCEIAADVKLDALDIEASLLGVRVDSSD